MMLSETPIDQLIEACRHVIESGFDEEALLQWRLKARDFLNDEVGPDHKYTQHFRNRVLEADSLALLSGGVSITGPGMKAH
ncbi:hypothetical protein ACFL2Q_03105 [Thermodesulfobacteriota bacterium]